MDVRIHGPRNPISKHCLVSQSQGPQYWKMSYVFIRLGNCCELRME